MEKNVIHVNGEAEFQSKVLSSASPVLVDFWAPWCGPCRMLAPILDGVAAQYAGRAAVAKVNIDEDENRDIAVRYGIMNIPAVFIFKNGELVQKHIGAKPAKAFTDALDSLL